MAKIKVSITSHESYLVHVSLVLCCHVLTLNEVVMLRN